MVQPREFEIPVVMGGGDGGGESGVRFGEVVFPNEPDDEDDGSVYDPNDRKQNSCGNEIHLVLLSFLGKAHKKSVIRNKN